MVDAVFQNHSLCFTLFSDINAFLFSDTDEYLHMILLCDVSHESTCDITQFCIHLHTLTICGKGYHYLVL